MSVCITESLCYILETNTTLQINYISIQFFRKRPIFTFVYSRFLLYSKNFLLA